MFCGLQAQVDQCDSLNNYECAGWCGKEVVCTRHAQCIDCPSSCQLLVAPVKDYIVLATACFHSQAVPGWPLVQCQDQNGEVGLNGVLPTSTGS